MNILNKEWDESYIKKQNFCFYPNEELVKFLNRFIRKKCSNNIFINLIGDNLKALDFGCGIGSSTNLLHDFNIECIGVDISKEALYNANIFFPDCKFELIDSPFLKYDDQFFDFSISIHCLDSMDNNITNKIFNELMRVSKKYLFITLISTDELDNTSFDGQIIVKTEHEKNTIQNYFTVKKIENLVKNSNFKIKYLNKVVENDLLNNKNNGRYYIVFERK